jgi:hypothetical protein
MEKTLVSVSRVKIKATRRTGESKNMSNELEKYISPEETSSSDKHNKIIEVKPTIISMSLLCSSMEIHKQLLCF